MFVEVRLRCLTAERAAKRRSMMLEFIMNGKCRGSEIKLGMARDHAVTYFQVRGARRLQVAFALIYYVPRLHPLSHYV